MGNRALAVALGAVFAVGLVTSPVAAARGGVGPDAMVKVIVNFREPVGRADRLQVKAAGGQVDPHLPVDSVDRGARPKPRPGRAATQSQR